jgi:hypothetical protein
MHWRLLAASNQARSMLASERSLGKASPEESRVLSDLDSEGVHVTSLDRLLTSASAHEIISRASLWLRTEHARVQPAWWSRGTSSTDLSAEVLLTRAPELYLLGLNDGLLKLVHRYLRLPVAYHGAVLRHSLIDGEKAGPRLWHQDAEDVHVLRMVVYLTDVTSGAGPFEYIPRHLGLTYRRIDNGLAPLTDERMRQVIPQAQWKRIIAPAGTVVLADTAKVFHHESMQTDTERFVIMIGYSSRQPSGMDLAMAHFPVERVKAALQRIVPASNYGHVFGWRRALA